MKDYPEMQDEIEAAGAASALDDGLGVLLNGMMALRCPFCGKSKALEIITGAKLMDEEQEYWQHSASYSVVCNAAKPNGKGGCGAMSGFADTEVAAVNRWNTRTPNLNSPTPTVG
jgi:hypothetical protein